MEKEMEKPEDIDTYLETWNNENTVSEEDEENVVGESENEKSSVEEADEDTTEENASNDEEQAAAEANEEKKTETESEDSNKGTVSDAPEEETQKTDSPSEKESSKDGKQLLEEKLATELPAIQKEYPDVKSAADIENLGAYVVLTGMCKMSPVAAYRALKGLPGGENAKRTDERGIYPSASKAHLTAAVPKGASAPEGLSRAELKEYSEALDLDEREVKALYNRVKN